MNWKWIRLLRRRALVVVFLIRDLASAIRRTGSYGWAPLVAVLFGLALVALALSMAGTLAPFIYPVF